MDKTITYVGLDVHKASINVAVKLDDEGLVEWKTISELGAVRKLVRKLERASPGLIHCCYEAGPLGFALKRSIEQMSVRVKCSVVAPSLIPVKPGERIKTDRRDAKKLCQLFRAGLLTEVHAPSVDDEAVRDLVRARDDARDDLTRARHRLSKLLLRHGHIFTLGRAWTHRHREWLRQIEWTHEADRVVFDDYRQTIDFIEERMKGLDAKIAELSINEPYATAVSVLRCFHGVETLTAMIILAELHDFRRFRTARALMAFLGLVPGERSSGESVRRGGITKAGNKFLRRILIEAAWHYLQRPTNSAKLKKRRDGQPAVIVSLARKAPAATAPPISHAHRRTQEVPIGGRRGNRSRARRLLMGSAVSARMHEGGSLTAVHSGRALVGGSRPALPDEWPACVVIY